MGFVGCFFLVTLVLNGLKLNCSLLAQSRSSNESYYLKLLNISQSDESKDYVYNKTQFQLSSLLTEQSHNKTKFLSQTAKNDTRGAMNQLLSVDEDIVAKISNLTSDFKESINSAVITIKTKILNGDKIYVYGTGSTGRLAKQIENIWREFWENSRKSKLYKTIEMKLSASIKDFGNIDHKVIGEITGADRTLISSLEGFEDLQLIGELQFKDNIITERDVVFAVTEGGETSAVIGTILYASTIIRNKSSLFFVYNNPDDLLLKFDRSRAVLENVNITKLNFATGPQGITGSTRMQATSSQTYLLGCIVEAALGSILREHLTLEEVESLGFESINTRVVDLLERFNETVLTSNKVVAPSIAAIAESEYQTYKENSHTFYFGKGLITTLFIDLTERSPTFSLDPVDSKIAPYKSWLKILIYGEKLEDSWKTLLKRDFHGLSNETYYDQFVSRITDEYLKVTALKSLSKAGSEQQYLYDFSLDFLINNQTISDGDLGLGYFYVDELFESIQRRDTIVFTWLEKVSLAAKEIHLVVVCLEGETAEFEFIKQYFRHKQKIKVVSLLIPIRSDPMRLNRKLALKLFLNTQSTFIMAKLERVLGNSMVYVTPTNLKLIGRATFLLQLHVNSIISAQISYKEFPQISYLESNAILLDAKSYLDSKKEVYVPVIPVAFIRIFETIMNKQLPVSWEFCVEMLNRYGTLNQYIENRVLKGKSKELRFIS